MADETRTPAIIPTDQTRADIGSARATLLRAMIDPESADLTTAAAMEAALASLCPHTREAWQTGDDPGTGRPLTTCYRCNVSWFADYAERLRHVSSYREEGQP